MKKESEKVNEQKKIDSKAIIGLIILAIIICSFFFYSDTKSEELKDKTNEYKQCIDFCISDESSCQFDAYIYTKSKEVYVNSNDLEECQSDLESCAEDCNYEFNKP